MTIETPEYLALVAEHKLTTANLATLTSDLAASVEANKVINAKLNDATTKLSTAEACITDLKAGIEKMTAEHKTAISDFDKKVAAASQAQLAASGAQAVDLGSAGASANASDVYEEFSKADPIKAKEMLDDPSTNKIIRAESKRRNAITK